MMASLAMFSYGVKLLSLRKSVVFVCGFTIANLNASLNNIIDTIESHTLEKQ